MMTIRVTLWRSLLSMVILITLISARENFKCTNQITKNCSCSTKSINSFTIQCESANIFVSITDFPSNSIDIRCDQNTRISLSEYSSVYEHMPILVGNSSDKFEFSFINCPLPNVTFHTVIGKMGIADKLKIRFNKAINQNLTDHLEGLKHLTELDLQHNGLEYLADNIFDYMINLRNLNLCFNNVKPNIKLFKSLSILKTLDLGGNQIAKLTKRIFLKMSSLQILNLTSNNMEEINPKAFDGLNKMTHLDLSYNDLNTLPSMIFSTLTSLQYLSIRNNNFTSLSGDLFKNSTDLESIFLQNNMIENIPTNLFVNQKNLKYLDISFNKIKRLPNEVFETLGELQILYLDNNDIQYLQSILLEKLKQLREISMKNNQISIIEDGSFSTLSNLIKTDMSHNELNFHSDISPFNECLQIEDLDLSYNKITKINYLDWQISFVKLKKLNLSHNCLAFIRYEDITFNSVFHLEVDLRHNTISEINFKTVPEEETLPKNLQPQSDDSNTKVLIDHNPINCNCCLHKFVLYLQGKLDPEVRSKVEVVTGDLTCKSPQNLNGKLVNNLHLNELICPLDIREKMCPKHCECFVRFYNSALIVNCSGIVDVPDFSYILGKNNWINQTELHLEGNHITSLDKLHLNTGNRNITRLYLRNNNITQLNISENIEVLDLRNNQLSVVDGDVLATLQCSRIQKMWLSQNPLSCDCANKDFISFLQENHTKVVDFMLLTCPDNSKVSSLALSFLCSPAPAVLAAIVLIVVAIIAAVRCTIIFYKYRYDIKVYLYNKGWLLFWVTEEEVDINKICDAYVSYAPEDEWFLQNLLEEIENKPPFFKLRFESRDFLGGVFKTTDIRKSIEKSKRTIVVLSPNFLNSVWNKEELKQAHCNALKEGQTRVIPILLDEMGSLQNLDVIFQSYLHNTPLLKFGDLRFWKRLRYALPHPPCPKNCSYYILSLITCVIALPRVIFINLYNYLSKKVRNCLKPETPHKDPTNGLIGSATFSRREIKTLNELKV